MNQKNVSENVNLSKSVFDCFFCDEHGNQYEDYPDLLGVERETVIKQFPQTADWPIVREHEDRFGYAFGHGIYLFPDFDFENPKFEAI